MSLGLSASVSNPRRDEARWAAVPGVVKGKLSLLGDRADATFAASSAFLDRVTATRDELRAAQGALRRAQQAATPTRTIVVPGRDPWTGALGLGTVEVGGPAPPELAHAVARLTAELARLDAAHQPLIKRAADARRLHTACKTWLDRVDLAALRVLAVPRPKVAHGDHLGDVEKLRTRLAAIAGEVEAIEQAPVPVAEARERLTALLASGVERAPVDVRALFSARGVTDLRHLVPMLDPLATGTQAAASYGRLLDLLVAVAAEPMKALFHRAIEAHVLAAKPIPSRDRPGLLDKLAREQRDLAVREEVLICLSEAEGREGVDRRPEADPSVVLLVALDAAA